MVTKHKRIRSSTRPAVPRTECFLLCDYARVQHGKLDILGGGWEHVQPESLPASHHFALALKLSVPTEHAADDMALRIELLNDRGEILDPGMGEFKFQLQLDEEEARSLAVGKDYSASFAISADVILERVGTYTIRLVGNDQPLAHVSFVVGEPPASDEP